MDFARSHRYAWDWALMLNAWPRMTIFCRWF